MNEPPTERMSRSRASGGALRLRLRGWAGERQLSAPLAEGDNLVGSASTGAVVVPVRGVSRHHALVRVERGAAQVEDLGSKNGLRVNGRIVVRSFLEPGDAVSFGPVTLRLEEVAAEDAELGVALPADTEEPTKQRSDPGATSLLATAEGPAMAWLRLVEEVVDRLGRPPGDPQGALEAVVRHLGLTGAALVEWRGPVEPVIERVAGRLGELPSERQVVAARESGGSHSVETTGGPCALWTERGKDGGARGLALWGELAGGRESALLLSTLGRLFRGAGTEEMADLGGPRGGDREGLRFPDGYVAGESPAMRALYRQMEMLADSELPVLICGETGVGKEPLAGTLHASSTRHAGPFVAVNCAAIPADLLEAEMFGIGRNVATGVAGRQGKFVAASGGTLFLDEIGDMPPPLQAKLLRALQEGEVQPVGSAPVAVDVRVVAATNVDLRVRAESGGFRRDLYYRLAGLVLDVPPLRDRPEDLPPLVAHFLRRAGRDAGHSVRGLTVKALRHLTAYPWPGNVRELEHEIRRLVHLCPHGGIIDSLMLADHVLVPPPAPGALSAGDSGSSLDLRAHTEALESRLIRLALARTEGNQSRAAELLGISRNGLANRLKRFRIDPSGSG